MKLSYVITCMNSLPIRGVDFEMNVRKDDFCKKQYLMNC